MRACCMPIVYSQTAVAISARDLASSPSSASRSKVLCARAGTVCPQSAFALCRVLDARGVATGKNIRMRCNVFVCYAMRCAMLAAHFVPARPPSTPPAAVPVVRSTTWSRRTSSISSESRLVILPTWLSRCSIVLQHDMPMACPQHVHGFVGHLVCWHGLVVTNLHE